MAKGTLGLREKRSPPLLLGWRISSPEARRPGLQGPRVPDVKAAVVHLPSPYAPQPRLLGPAASAMPLGPKTPKPSLAFTFPQQRSLQTRCDPPAVAVAATVRTAPAPLVCNACVQGPPLAARRRINPSLTTHIPCGVLSGPPHRFTHQNNPLSGQTSIVDTRSDQGPRVYSTFRSTSHGEEACFTTC